MDQKGIKNLSEAVEALLELSVGFASLAKDGVQVSDIPALFAMLQEEPLRSKLVAAGEKMSDIPSEVKDLDLSEGMQLAMLVLTYVPKLVSALKK